MDEPPVVSTPPPAGDSGGPVARNPLVAIGLLLLFLGGVAFLPRVFSSKDAMFGKDAPDFTGAVVANDAALSPPRDTLKLSELRGKAVVIDFWASWCGPCQAEAPIVNNLAQRWRDRDVVVVGVNTSDARGNARAWAKAMGVSFPIVYDDDEKIAGAFDVHNLPTLVVVSRAGKIVAVRQGMTDSGELEELVRKALL